MTGTDNDCSLRGAFEHHFGPRGREFERSNLQKFKCPGFARGGGMLKFRVDRRIKKMYGKFRAGLVHVGTEAAKEENKHSTTFTLWKAS